MFLPYTRVFMLSILTLASSLIYSAESPGAPLLGSRGSQAGENPFYSPLSTTEREPSPSPEAEIDIAPLVIAANPTNRKVSVLLFHNKGGYWASSVKTMTDQTVRDALNLEQKTLSQEEGKLYFIDTSEGDKKSSILLLPVEFTPVDKLRQAIKAESAVDDFIWVPVEEFTSRITALSKPLSSFAQQSALGKSSLALVDPKTQKAVKIAASRINAVGATPVHLRKKAVETA